ncbi:MAG: GNAT family N-acetyltransferase [Thalassotalea sp.]
MEIPIKTKNNESLVFRPLKKNDVEMLTEFFQTLSAATKAKFGPHPFTTDYLQVMLNTEFGNNNVARFIMAAEQKVVGYFIVDFNHYPNEKRRYAGYGVELNFSVDPVFAPCIHDDYQSQGVASLAMAALFLSLAKLPLRSLVLMGGTQAPNLLARHFYKKFNFKEFGEFYTDYNQLNNIDMRLVF